MSHDEEDSDKPSELTFLPSWIDFFLALVLWMVVSSQTGQGKGKAQGHHIGETRVGKVPHSEVVNPHGITNIGLLPDGTLRLDGEPTTSQDLISRLSKENDKRSILISIDTASNGQGALKAWFQLQVELSQAKLWNRVRVEERSTQPSNNLSPGQTGVEP